MLKERGLLVVETQRNHSESPDFRGSRKVPSPTCRWHPSAWKDSARMVLATVFLVVLASSAHAMCPIVLPGAGERVAEVVTNPWSLGPREELTRIYASVGGCEGAARFYQLTLAVLRGQPLGYDEHAELPCRCAEGSEDIEPMPALGSRGELERWANEQLSLTKGRLLGREYSCAELASLAWIGQLWWQLAGKGATRHSAELELVIRAHLLLATLPAHCAGGKGAAENAFAVAGMFADLGDYPSAAAACAVGMQRGGPGIAMPAEQAARRGWLDFCTTQLWRLHLGRRSVP